MRDDTMNRLKRLLACFLLLAMPLPLAAQAADDALTAAQMREDLVFLSQEWAPRDKSFSDTQRQEFDRLVEQAMAAADTMTPTQFAFQIMRASALARNGHTGANAAALLGRDLPVRAWWFADGLHVVKAHPAFKRLLGARIERIGSLDAETAHERVKPYLAGNDQRIRFLSPGYLVTPAVLKEIGAIDDERRVSLALRLRDGALETLDLEPSAEADPGDERAAGLNRGYGVLIPDGPNLAGRWPHVLDRAGPHPPLYSVRRDVQASFLDAEKQVLYIRNDTVESIDDTPLTDKFGGIVLKSILPHTPRGIIVDLRLNNGGDFFNTILFAQALPRLLPQDGRIAVLVGRATFSAGIVTAAMIKGAGGDRVMLVGEAMGDNGRFWAEGKRMKLPNSRIALQYGAQFQDYEAGCTDTKTCYWATVAFGPRGISLAPEVTRDVAFGDYAAGKDPVLEAAREALAAK